MTDEYDFLYNKLNGLRNGGYKYIDLPISSGIASRYIIYSGGKFVMMRSNHIPFVREFNTIFDTIEYFTEGPPEIGLLYKEAKEAMFAGFR